MNYQLSNITICPFKVGETHVCGPTPRGSGRVEVPKSQRSLRRQEESPEGDQERAIQGATDVVFLGIWDLGDFYTLWSGMSK